MCKDSGKLVLRDGAFLGFQDGVLTVGTRTERFQKLVQQTLDATDCKLWFPDFRTAVVRVEQGGQTTTERRDNELSQRRQAAQQAARESLAVKAFEEIFNARLDVDGVEPPAAPEEAAPVEMEAEA